MKKSYQVVLRLKEQNVPGKANKADFIVVCMTDNPYFADPNPPLSVIMADSTNVKNAVAAAEGGGKKFTADMHAKEEILERDLHTLGAYVETIANKPENLPKAVAIITSAGMEIKTARSRGATKLQVNATGVSGEVKMRTAYVRNSIYHWQISSDGITWTEIGLSRKGSFIHGGLTPGVKHYFRVGIEDKDGMGPWSDAVSGSAM